ncbi:hypothetical protein LshimejAT787_0603630 [Lyophyllum shimeji]|uniref:Uncharacterized protein n=1 Tax=Lyophyllum shimeji TaxID=47721 RepID=A0A9P3PP49_LYOSH|nr:hypothetical protein LshimejAT787_0603630 [Lyophyllum shimeji]
MSNTGRILLEKAVEFGQMLIFMAPKNRFHSLAHTISTTVVYLHPEPSYSSVTSNLLIGDVMFADDQRDSGTDQPSPGVYICTTDVRTHAFRVGAYWYAAVLLVETVLLGLALAKAWQYRSSSEIQSPLMKQLTRDSLRYFFMLFWIYLANLVVSAKDITIVAEFGIPFGFALPSILANRLLIRIRSTYFRSFPQSEVDAYLPPLQFATSNAPSSRREREEDERQGSEIAFLYPPERRDGSSGSAPVASSRFAWRPVLSSALSRGATALQASRGRPNQCLLRFAPSSHDALKCRRANGKPS